MIDENKIYTTPFPLSILYRWIGLIMFYVLFFFLLRFGGGILFLIVLGNYDFDSDHIFFIIGLFLGLTVFLPSGINQYPIIKVDETGLYIKIFFFVYIWHLIPWEEVKEIYRYDRLPRFPIWFVRVTKLIFWFRIVSQQHRQGFHPSILIHSYVTDYDELVEIIKKKISQN